MDITTIGMDLAKNVFQVHGIDGHGQVVLRKTLARSKVLGFFTALPPCTVGMEACGGAHYWARQLQAMGHTVHLMAPQFVKAYVKTNKNDAADAEAICEAVGRPTMRFVAIKTEEQQAILSLHRVRQQFVKQRTAQANAVRGLLAEFGIVLPSGIRQMHRVPERIDHPLLPAPMPMLLQRLYDHFQLLDQQVEALEQQIRQWHQQSAASQRLAEIPGIGPITATALVASIGDARQFQSARQLSAWFGLVPRQHSSGGKSLLLGISKRGDGYLRMLLIHGARAVIRYAADQPASSWINRLLARRPKNVAIVALANQHARIAWALLRYGDRHFRADYGPNPGA